MGVDLFPIEDFGSAKSVRLFWLTSLIYKETIPQVEMLQKMRCDRIQGYVFDRPMPISEFELKYKDDPDLMNFIKS